MTNTQPGAHGHDHGRSIAAVTTRERRTRRTALRAAAEGRRKLLGTSDAAPNEPDFLGTASVSSLHQELTEAVPPSKTARCVRSWTRSRSPSAAFCVAQIGRAHV